MKFPTATLLTLATLPLTACVVGEGGPLPWSQDYAERIPAQSTDKVVVETPDIDESIDDVAGANPVALAIESTTTYSTEVRDFNTGVPISGATATLDRKGSGNTINESTSRLPPGHVVALFFVAFNHPENCKAPFAPLSKCSEADLENAAAEPTILWADGEIASGGGRATFAASIGLNLAGAPGEVVFGGGLTNPKGAEVHLLARDKGTPISGSTTLQKTTFDGGCDVRACADVQFAIFKGL